MKHWTTKIRAVDPLTGKIKTYNGPVVPAPCKELAEQYCQINGLGYCQVEDELVAEIPAENGRPIWSRMIDYSNEN